LESWNVLTTKYQQIYKAFFHGHFSINSISIFEYFMSGGLRAKVADNWVFGQVLPSCAGDKLVKDNGVLQ
jgi:hypothetical protein